MRLLVIVDTYVPARISGALQMHDLAREMLVQGNLPTVVVPAPELQTPWQVDRVDGVEVLRVRTLRTKDVGKLRRALAEWWLPHALLRGLRASPLASVKWDGVVWYSPTIFLGPMVRAVKRQHGCPSYLILRDLFPDWAVDTGVMRRGVAYLYLKRIARTQYASADVIGVQTFGNESIVAQNAPKDVTIETLHNWLAKPKVKSTSIDLSRGPLAGRTIFAYCGNMGAAQGMDCLLELARDLHHRRDVGFLFVGRGSEVPRLRGVLATMGLDNVQFFDEVPADEIPGILAQCHVGMIALDPRHKTHNIPGKLLSYLYAGLPVLARVNPSNDLIELIVNRGIGRATSADSSGELKALALDLLDSLELRPELRKDAFALALEQFSPTIAARQVTDGLNLHRAQT